MVELYRLLHWKLSNWVETWQQKNRKEVTNKLWSRKHVYELWIDYTRTNWCKNKENFRSQMWKCVFVPFTFKLDSFSFQIEFTKSQKNLEIIQWKQKSSRILTQHEIQLQPKKILSMFSKAMRKVNNLQRTLCCFPL